MQLWLQRLSATERHQIKTGHMADVAELRVDEGLWLNIPVLLALARKF